MVMANVRVRFRVKARLGFELKLTSKLALEFKLGLG